MTNSLAGVEFLRAFAIGTGWLVIGVGLVQSAIHLAHLAIARRVLGRTAIEPRSEILWQRYSDVAPPIALLVPAYNEEKTIVESIHSLLALAYPYTEIIVVNDGSSDRTLDLLKETFKLEPVERSYDRIAPHADIRSIFGTPKLPRLLVVDKENGGKADALNAAINLARSPLIAAIDADSILDSDSLIRAVRPFVNDPVLTVAAGGTVRIANGCRIRSGRIVDVGLPRNMLALFQIIEYLRAFLAARLALSALNTLTIISGAFGIFRRNVVLDVGGYSLDTVGEDLELVIKIHRHLMDQGKEYTIDFVPDPVCWTEVPETLAALGNQRPLATWRIGGILQTYQDVGKSTLWPDRLHRLRAYADRRCRRAGRRSAGLCAYPAVLGIGPSGSRLSAGVFGIDLQLWRFHFRRIAGAGGEGTSALSGCKIDHDLVFCGNCRKFRLPADQQFLAPARLGAVFARQEGLGHHGAQGV